MTARLLKLKRSYLGHKANRPLPRKMADEKNYEDMDFLQAIIGLFGITLSVNNYVLGNDVASLVVVGDISFDNSIRYFGDRSCDYFRPFDNVKDIIQSADLAIGNFETPLVVPSMTNDPLVKTKEIHLGAWAHTVQGLKYAGFSVVGLANNHLIDFGDASVNLTTNTLKFYDIPYVGVTYGRYYYTRQKPFIKVVKDIKIGLLAYCANMEGCYRIRNLSCSGPALYDFDVVKQDIDDLKSQNVDVKIVYFHWGTEYRETPSKEIIKICELVRSLNVEIILGSHQHVVQGHTLSTNNELVIYSLGNFLFHRNDKYKFMFYHNKTIDYQQLEEYKSTLGQVTTPTQKSRIFRIDVNKKGVVKAQYENLVIIANHTDYCIQPTPVKENDWIEVCQNNDINCLNSVVSNEV